MDLKMNSLLDLLTIGGPVIAILTILSVVMAAVVIFKLFQFSILKLWSFKKADQLVCSYLSDQGVNFSVTSYKDNNPVLRLLIVAHKLGAEQPDHKSLAEEEIACFASERIEEMRKGLRPLEFIGMISPLLGLLGTVLGMIEAFKELQLGGEQVDPSVLSGGIWVALLTTAAGLGIAIPAVTLHNFFESRIEKAVLRMERVASRVLAVTYSVEANVTHSYLSRQ